MKSVLLLSAYRSDSHAYWCDVLQQTLAADWRCYELPGRYFRWRIRGNALSWRQPLTELLQRWQPDHILATSMVDLATLRGLVPALASVPASYYFHENQFAYPISAQQHGSVDPMMVQLYGALSAQQLLFNSKYNRDSFFAGLETLLQRLPDQVPKGIVKELRARSAWLPVPVRSIAAKAKTHHSVPLLLWNHRWEYDKQPEGLLQLLRSLTQPVRLALLGGRSNKVPDALRQIRREFAGWIVVDDFPSRTDYEAYLAQADVVFSSAKHEFQGISVLEAVTAGARPLVPDDLCYREQYPTANRYAPDDFITAAGMLDNWQSLPQVSVEPWLELQALQRWQHWLAQL